jgi:four helix bundle suffix protein
MAEAGYKSLITYKLSLIAFTIGWEFVPEYYFKYEDSRQRDQIKQALRSLKQNIVEGSSERSLSTKLKLYDVAKSSGMEACEDFEDILRLQKLSIWNKNDFRLSKLRQIIEGYPKPNPSMPSYPSSPSVSLVLETLRIRGNRGNRRIRENKEGIEAVCNYLVDVLIRCGSLLDRQINSVEELHKKVGGYSENLYKKRVEYRKTH